MTRSALGSDAAHDVPVVGSGGAGATAAIEAAEAGARVVLERSCDDAALVGGRGPA